MILRGESCVDEAKRRVVWVLEICLDKENTIGIWKLQVASFGVTVCGIRLLDYHKEEECFSWLKSKPENNKSFFILRIPILTCCKVFIKPSQKLH